MEKNEQVSLRVPADIREDIERLAEAIERSMAWHMVKAIPRVCTTRTAEIRQDTKVT
jgi:predicted transcriptional regulator